MNQQPLTEQESTKTKEVRITSEDIWSKEFWLGFAVWYLANGIYWIVKLGNQTLWEYAGDNFLILAPTFCLNLLALIVLFSIKTARRFTIGILAAMASNIIIAVLLGVVENAWFFLPFFANQ